MHIHIIKFKNIALLMLTATLFSSCFMSQKVAYFEGAADSTRIASLAGVEPVIQKDDILSISVSSLSNEATVIFNAPNLPITPNNMPAISQPQTAGYLVNQDGDIKFPVLGSIHVAGLTPQELEKRITDQLIEKQLLYDPVVSSRFLNFRVTVLGEVNKPGVIYASGEQINILEALGQAGDLTIYGLRDNVLLIRQEGDHKIMKRINLNSSEVLSSPYYFLKSNDIIYVEPGKNKVASTDATLRILPVVFSGVSVIVVVLNSLLK